MKAIVEIANFCIEEIIKKLDPANYEADYEDFIGVALCAPAMISASMIEKTAEMFHLKQKEVLDFFIMKVNAALELQLLKNEKLKSAH